MRMLLLFILSIALTPAARASPPPFGEAIDGALLSSTSPDTLRARLEAFATGTTNHRQASQALYYRGLSFDRGAMPDSAIASYRRANALGRNPGALSALIDALLRRRAEGDVADAIHLLEQMREADEAGVETVHFDPARLGWAYVLSGDAKRGVELLAPLESRLANDPQWHYRLARAHMAAGNSTRATGYLTMLNTASRGQDREVAAMIKRLDNALPTAHVAERVSQMLKAHDDDEIALLERLGGRRLRLLASDGAMVGGAVFADTTAKREARAAVVLAGPGDELRDYDSLTVALRRSGFAVFLLDPRGSGWSVAPEFSLPDTWEGRQDALAARVARDVHDAISALRRVARVDTTRVLLIGVGSMAPIAFNAAATDARVAAMALLDPWTSPVDRGTTLQAARRTQVPTFIHVSVPGREETVFVDTLFHSVPQRTSRLVESPAFSSGAAAFGSRPDVTPRFVRWLGETFSARPSRRVIRPATPRPG